MRNGTLTMMVLVVGCATTSASTNGGASTAAAPDCPTTCAAKRDSCLQQAGPAPAAGAPENVNQKEWDKRFAQQKASQACSDDFRSCTAACQ